jgi:hypothetical protein
MNTEKLVGRVNALIELGERGLATTEPGAYTSYRSVNSTLFNEFRAASLSFIESLFGPEHTYYKEFDRKVQDTTEYYTKYGLGILLGIKREIEGGWLQELRGLVAAEFFADFLEMAEHLLEQGYKDPAAVLAGSTLEEHLRQLSSKFGVAVAEERDGKLVPRKADTLNADLVKATAYNKLDQKSVTGWLDLRNKAAHGHYGEYGQQQVQLMIAAVRDFITRNPV